MANEPKQPEQQIEQPPTKAVDDKKNASPDKKPETEQFKNPGEGV